MNTQAISNIVNTLPTPAGTKQDSGTATDPGAFSQMLSREMGDRSSPAPAPSASAKNDTPVAGEKSRDNGAHASPSNGNSGTNTSDNTKVAQDETGTSETAKAETKVDESETDPAAAAELAAFVAAMTQANPTPAAVVGQTGEEAALGAVGKRIGKDDALADLKPGNTQLDAAVDGKKEAVGKPADFVAALDKAANTASANASKGTSITQADVEKAFTQTIKTVDAPNASNVSPLVANSATSALQQLNDVQNQQAANRLTPHLGSQDWNQALGQKVVWMVQGLQQTVTLTLNPPDMGPMQVTVNVHNNQATANFTAPQPEVRHALEAAMPRLREMLNDAGIQLGESSVSAGNPNQQGNAFSDSRQGHRHTGDGNIVDTSPVVSQISVTAGGNGLVDTFA
ncbi:flagellar hook-length control protein FliK [uncultured Oxalicibacterium sp.]|uniref:flagellar hook-length control protein FliK n=1 Tax=uncultured Oxalicibacterium sp. TaxID=1168540 RepID=UPI0025EBD484|nr:flagellar hook-length control protein FliK [uncultured Oxalicibacterium sp.]